MSGSCAACGESTIWDQDLGSSVCTQCGTLADPTQSVLTSHLEPSEESMRETLWSAAPANIPKGRNGWALAGQDKEARGRKNTLEMHGFIHTIALRLSKPGLTLRARAIFDQAMAKGQYRWGRRAKLVAGASVSIALRESNQGDALRDVAYLLNEPHPSLSRAYTAVLNLLHLKITPADPALHLPTLQSHLLTLIQSSPPALPAKLLTTLVPLAPRLPPILRTATALSALLARAATFTHLPAPPTAAALLLLALEAELGGSLPNAGELAKALGARVGAAQGTVMQRYKAASGLVEECAREVPWLAAHERGKGRARAKVARRVVVARGLKDVLQFQEEIWKKKMEAVARPCVALEVDEGEESDRSDDEGESRSEDTVGRLIPSARAREDDDISGPPRKRRKTAHEKSVAQASRFLLDPTSCTAPPPEIYKGGSEQDIVAHLLTTDTANISYAFTNAPSRLQLLAVSRGGATEENIPDEELFAEGELEGLMRTADEMEVLRRLNDWDTGDDDSESSLCDLANSEREKDNNDPHGIPRNGKTPGSKRINMDALARLLDPSSIIDGDGEVIFREDVDMVPFTIGDDGEIIEEWRPMSPDGGGFEEDRYHY
ncbi:hypothetical protein WOLCODRAFT_88121 [Wolfiporia cocos MD-104 SS10]|uniref:TFIIB-type domain-containing protein n=1 Tax=Wolfiporia cocos (strain MD-104) TaxID=742152 RepID=A0A2H3J965_WOLCO|nr:hypothetical protein WOLCODRAFT_88121 [Wolfiporia cocos MD-104 SS10]